MPGRAILHKARAAIGLARLFISDFMRSEAQCPASARYLYADELYTDSALHRIKADCRHWYQNRAKSAAYATFINWTRQPNEAAVFTRYAYADLMLPKRFDCLFHFDNPQQHLLVSYELTQSALVLGGFHPLNSLEHGHKHLCVFEFEHEVPAVLQLLPVLEDSPAAAPPTGAFKLGFCQATDLPAIVAEHERIARLRAQYGPQWWKHDEEMWP
jgi:hypothetical protein